MARQFNDTGLCVPHKHFMVDISAKVSQIMRMINGGLYFTINSPRQFGKTTTLLFIDKELKRSSDYLSISLSFEGIGNVVFEDEATFCEAFLDILSTKCKDADLSDFLATQSLQTKTFKELSKAITLSVERTSKKIVILIDEVDKSSNNQLFLLFIGMLRDKYLNQNAGNDATFHSVILVGVHDVKTLKIKIAPDGSGKLNSPWNIAADFKVELNFRPTEIATMLVDYVNEKNVTMDIPAIAERLYFYTSGYPFLVSKVCKTIDEEILTERDDKNWSVNDVELAFNYLVRGEYQTTNFDDLIKNFENNPDLYEVVFSIVMNGSSIAFTKDNPVILLGSQYGILAKGDFGCKIHNRIYEQRIYNYFISRQFTDGNRVPDGLDIKYYKGNGLDLKYILQKFQQFMKENFSQKDEKFLEREGRLLFLSFLKPILNGKGFDFKEPVTGDERRIDVVLTYQNLRFVVELKRWYGEEYHQKGLQQLSDYLDSYSLTNGYLLIFDFTKKKEYREADITFNNKQIFAAWV